MQARFDAAGAEEVLDSATPSLLVAINGGLVKITKLGNAAVSGEVLMPLTSDAEAKPRTWQIVAYMTPEENRRVSDREVSWLEYFREKGMLKREFNWAFFTSGDSREPELAGIKGRAGRLRDHHVRHTHHVPADRRRRRDLSRGVRPRRTARPN